ncbi:MAG TPA: hypothetical protein PLX62_11575 [Bacteroidales bacterium]|nr:hypothetical protein [Bacteroidales bacterium]
MKNLLIGVMVGGILVITGLRDIHAEYLQIMPLKIEQVEVLSQGQMALNAGLAYEMGREFLGREYDNIRLAPLGLRRGVGDSAEVGGFIAFSSNMDDDRNAPDESGLEGLTLFYKLGMNEYFALQAGIAFLGNDDIAPYANDGVDLFVNVPMQRRISSGLLYGQFGYRTQGGDFDGTDYFNFGIGYGLSLNNKMGFNFELVGEGEHKGTRNTLDLIMGSNFLVNNKMRFVPYVSIGIYDDSPDVAIGSLIYYTF